MTSGTPERRIKNGGVTGFAGCRDWPFFRAGWRDLNFFAGIAGNHNLAGCGIGLFLERDRGISLLFWRDDGKL